ncbi:MAG: glycosyltransferase family 39 protein [Candidatus Eisenbacteria bacterium]
MTLRRWGAALADLGLLALGIGWVARLAAFARGAVFQSDECFHATVAEWIAAHGRLPREISSLYSGFAYFYAPLFHVLGAVWIRVLGAGALWSLNVVVSAAIVLAAWGAARAAAGRDAARWAAALVMTSPGIARYAARLYVEPLSTLLALVALWALIRFGRGARTRDAIALGVASGLAWLAKPSALVLPALWLALAAVALAHRRRDLARGLVLAVGMAVVVASPLWLRDWILFGSPVYPAFAPDRHVLVDRLNQTTYSLAPGAFAGQMLSTMGAWIPACALAVVGLAWRDRRARPVAMAIGVCAAMIALAPLQPMVEPRHLHPVVAALAVLGAVGLARVARPALVPVLGVLALGAAALAVFTLANPRPEFDPDPAVMEAYAAMRRVVPPDATVLSLWTYDTAYYTGRAATWPIPWGQRDHPVEMFFTADCDSVATSLERHRIGWVLMPADTPGDSVFDGANYPRSFVGCMGRLADAGRARVAWRSDDLELLEMRR